MGYKKKLPRAKEGLWLTKDNELIRMHTNMTALSYKITNYLLWRATLEKDIRTSFTVTAAEIVKACNIKDSNYSKVLDEETSKIMGTWIEIRNPDGEGYIKIGLMDKLEYHKGGILEAKITESMTFLIGKLVDRNFTESNYELVNNCNSYASMRLYEVCNSWVNTTGRVYYTLDEWRKLTGGTGKTFEEFKYYKARLFLPAVETVNNHTDLEITPHFLKTGRKVSHIEIDVRRKNENNIAEIDEQHKTVPEIDTSVEQPPALTEQSQEEGLDGFSLAERDVIRKMVSDYKQPLKHAEKYIKTYGVEYCKEQMEYVRQESKHKKIDKIGGYFRRAIENDYAGSRQAQIAAVQAEEDEHKDIAAWNREIRQGSLFSFAADDEDLVQQILEGHTEVAEMYRGMGMTDEKIARWLEKYSEVLLLKTGVRLQTEDYVTAEYVEAALASEQTKRKRLGGKQVKESFQGDGEDGKGRQNKGLESISEIIEEASPEDEYTIWLKKKNAIRHDLIEKMKTNPEKFSLEMLKQALAKYDEMCPCPLPQTDRTNSD